MQPHTIRSFFTRRWARQAAALNAHPTRFRRRPLRTSVRLLLAFTLAIAAILSFAQSAFAVHDIKFQLDGNTAVDTGVAQPYDWESFFTNGGSGGDISKILGAIPNAAGFVASGFQVDYALPDATTFATGSKDTLDIGGWQCSKSNNLGDKVDIVNAYGAAFQDPSSGHLILYFGTEKASPNGDSNIATWFLHDPTVGCTATKGNTTFTGHHSTGDILLVSAFTNGGGTANVSAYEWVGGANGSLNQTPLATGQLCGAQPNDAACAITNTTAISPPWNHPDKDGGALNPTEFFEDGVDITQLLGTLTGPEQCFATFVSNTRSSASLTATLFDYAAGSLPVCGTFKVHKYHDHNANSALDPGDEGLSGWTINVTGPNNFSKTAVTDANGDVLTIGLVPSGTYHVCEVLQTDWLNSDPGPDTNTNPCKDVAVTTASTLDNTVVNFGNFQQGAIKITKTSTKGNAPLDDVTFSIKDANGNQITGSPFTTGAGGVSGQICVDHLFFGTYTVQEESAPAGYKIDNPNPVNVTVDHNATCTSGTPNTVPFTDTPLSIITVSFHSEVAGATTATIQCTGESSAQNLPDGTPHTLNDLVPGTYTCTVVIDP